MATIESLVSELNGLCKQYVSQKDDFQDIDKLQEVFNAIKTLGYNIVTSHSGDVLPDFELLSEEGKQDYEKMITIRSRKMAAIHNQEYERAADLRDIERKLDRKIKFDFWIDHKPLNVILTGKISELVVFDDPNSLLITLLK